MLGNPSIPSWGSRWGGIADIALKGWCIRGQGGVLEITRAGPFVPPISLPESDMGRMIWEVIVTDELRKMLETSGLSGFTFQPVVKKHIISMEWEKWALTETGPPEPLATDEFVDYFSNQTHDPQVASGIGNLWEMRLDFHAALKPDGEVVHWDGADWFRVKDPTQDTDYIYVSDEARRWLQQTVPAWVTFGASPALGQRAEIIRQRRSPIAEGRRVTGYKMVRPSSQDNSEQK